MFRPAAKIILGICVVCALLALTSVQESLALFFAICGIPLLFLAGAGLIAEGTVDAINGIPEHFVKDIKARVVKYGAEETRGRETPPPLPQ